MIEKKKTSRGISVTFKLPADVAYESVSVVGDFNNWDPSAHPMRLYKNKGYWSKSIVLKPGTYQFRYFVDGERWVNDDQADGYTASPFFSENCLLHVG